MNTLPFFTKVIFVVFFAASFSISCSDKKERQMEEQIMVSASTETANTSDSLWNSVTGNVSMSQIATYPNKVILTGLNDHRLISIYKSKYAKGAPDNLVRSKYSDGYEEGGDENREHFMPGIDILFGYNLLNIAHYNIPLEKVNFLFNHPVLVKTLYYPSYIQDSVDKQPINRNYYMVSVYDEDTNKDTLINKKDLRRFYYFDASSNGMNQLIPSDYSTIRSQYDPRNDIMYLFARHDLNKNGTEDKTEPIHIFWINLKSPGKAKRMY